MKAGRCLKTERSSSVTDVFVEAATVDAWSRCAALGLGTNPCGLIFSGGGGLDPKML